MATARFARTFFSAEVAFRELANSRPADVATVKRSFSRLNRFLRRRGLPVVHDGDYVTYRVLCANIGMPHSSCFTSLLYYHRCLYTLLQETDFERRCAEEIPALRQSLLCTAARRGYPALSMLHYIHFVAIPAIAMECFRRDPR
jgi:hypothetical protein